MPSRPDGIQMQRNRFIVNSDRSTKQGQPINAGTDSAAHQAIVGTLSMHPEDMQAAFPRATRLVCGPSSARRPELEPLHRGDQRRRSTSVIPSARSVVRRGPAVPPPP